MTFLSSRADLRIALALASVAALIRVMGVQRAIALLDRMRSRPSSLRPDEQVVSAIRIARRVQAVAARVPGRPRCLVRSIALASALRRHGIPADVQVGVAMEGGFAAHAWVEVHGLPVTDDPRHTGQYRALWAARHVPG